MKSKEEIKKALYKEKPEAVLQSAKEEGLYYKSTCSLGEINFFIPKNDIGDGFNDTEPAQLLIRWISE